MRDFVREGEEEIADKLSAAFRQLFVGCAAFLVIAAILMAIFVPSVFETIINADKKAVVPPSQQAPPKRVTR